MAGGGAAAAAIMVAIVAILSSSPAPPLGSRTGRAYPLGGEEAESSASKGSKDGSNKSTSTPAKKKFVRGKGK